MVCTIHDISCIPVNNVGWFHTCFSSVSIFGCMPSFSCLSILLLSVSTLICSTLRNNSACCARVCMSISAWDFCPASSSLASLSSASTKFTLASSLLHSAVEPSNLQDNEPHISQQNSGPWSYSFNSCHLSLFKHTRRLIISWYSKSRFTNVASTKPHQIYNQAEVYLIKLCFFNLYCCCSTGQYTFCIGECRNSLW